MASPPYSSPPKHHYQLSLTKRLETTKRKPETSNRTLGTQLEESLETAGIWRSRDRSDTDPTQIRRSSDTPRGSSESENRSPSFSGRRRLRPDLSRKVSSREMGRNSLPGGVKLSFPATKKLTMMERMSRRRVLSDGDFSGDFLCLQSGVNLKEALICQFPDGTEEIGAAQKGKSLREMLSPIFDRRNMSMNEYAVFLEQSNTPLLYSFDTFPLAGQTLLIQGNHYDATNEFTYNATSSFSRPRLHDPGSARSLHDDGAEIPDRLNRSSSLEFDEHNMSSIRRTHSEKEKHETESSEYTGISTKAKSISEQLERIKSNLNKTAGIPPLDFTDWKELVPQSIVETLGKKEMEQQHHIWELITTEHNHITIISTVINSLLTCLKELHNENFLTKINVHDVFLNIERIREVHLAFWNDCIVPLIDTARDTGELLNPELLTESSILFEEDLNHPLFEYCIKYIESRSYIKSQQHKNNDFKEYINWCSNEIRVQHNKLGVDDILIKPIQRIQKYPILIRDILRKTSDDDTRSVIASFLEKVKVFVEALNRRKEEKEEQQKIEGIKERIESYSVLPSVSNNTNDQINQILNKYNKFDLADKVPLLNTQRKFLHETSCKLDSKLDSKTQDVTLFLFSDHILVTRPNKGSKKKNRIIKQPMTLDRVEIEELHYASHTNVVVYLNEYGSLVDMFLLQSHSQESHTTLLNAVIQAKDNYKREKNKLYTEMDATKSVSTCSMNSAGNQQAESPAIARHVACSVTRSHSELGPTRRNMVDPASSVSRAQSMPASNDKRNHLPQSQSISSASSSSSSSSCSVSEGCNSEGSSRLATLSHIKESDKSLDSGEESTVIPNSDTLTGGTDPDTLKNYGPDVYIDNLSTEFKGKLDINKNICDTVNLQAADEKLFTKSDAIFIDHSNAQSES